MLEWVATDWGELDITKIIYAKAILNIDKKFFMLKLQWPLLPLKNRHKTCDTMPRLLFLNVSFGAPAIETRV